MNRKSTIRINSARRNMKSKNYSMKLKKARKIFIFSFFISVFLLGIFSNLPSTVNLDNALRTAAAPNGYIGNIQSSSYVPFYPKYTDFREQDFAEYLLNYFESNGAYPSKPSNFENTYYALKTLDFLYNTSFVDKNEIEQIVMSRYDENQHGFKEVNENASIPATYYAIECLKIMDSNISLSKESEILDFLNSTIVDRTYFVDRHDTTNVSSPEIIYQALSILDYFNVSGTGLNVFIDQNKTINHIISAYYNFNQTSEYYGLYTENPNNKFKDSYFAIMSFHMLGLFDQPRPEFTPQSVSIFNGTLVSGNNYSISAVDGDILTVSGDPSSLFKINLTAIFSMENIQPDIGVDYLDFIFNFDRTPIPDGLNDDGFISIYNAIEDKWEQLSDDLFFIRESGAEADIQFTSNDMNISDYIIENSGNPLLPDTYCRVNFSLSQSEAFTVYFDKIAYSYTLFNKKLMVDRTLDLFSGAFNPNILGENYYAVRILEELEGIDGFTRAQMDQLSQYVYSFQEEDGGFKLYDNSKYSSMQGTFYAEYLLEMMANTTVSQIHGMTEYIKSWHFPDGGFGSAGEVSLAATYRVVNYLNQIEYPIANISRDNILNYVDSCKLSNSPMFQDFDDEASIIEDTYYALKIKQMIDYNFTNSTELSSISEYLISQQTTWGYFMDLPNVRDVSFAGEILAWSGEWVNINYPEELKQCVIDLQMYFGGFYMNKTAEQPSIDATSFAVKAATDFGFVEDLRMVEEDQYPGVLDFVDARQDPVSGGILENDEPSLKNTYLVFWGISGYKLFHQLNTSGLIDYVISKVDYFNQIEELNSSTPGSEKWSFNEGVKTRCVIYDAYTIIENVRIHAEVLVEDEEIFPYDRPKIRINTYTPDGILIEGCDVRITQNDSTFILEDHQNGTYSVTLNQYNSTGHYELQVQINHENYVGFKIVYDLMICEPLEYNKLYSIKRQIVPFSKTMTLRVPIINKSSSTLVEGVDVNLVDESGKVITHLNMSEDKKYYVGKVDYNPWLPTMDSYFVQIKGDLVRTEAIPIKVYVFPTYFIIWAAAVVAVLVLASIYSVQRYQTIKNRSPEEIKLRADLKKTRKEEKETLKKIKSSQKEQKKKLKEEQKAQKKKLKEELKEFKDSHKETKETTLESYEKQEKELKDKLTKAEEENKKRLQELQEKMKADKEKQKEVLKAEKEKLKKVKEAERTKQKAEKERLKEIKRKQKERMAAEKRKFDEKLEKIKDKEKTLEEKHKNELENTEKKMKADQKKAKKQVKKGDSKSKKETKATKDDKTTKDDKATKKTKETETSDKKGKGNSNKGKSKKKSNKKGGKK